MEKHDRLDPRIPRADEHFLDVGGAADLPLDLLRARTLPRVRRASEAIGDAQLRRSKQDPSHQCKRGSVALREPTRLPNCLGESPLQRPRGRLSVL